MKKFKISSARLGALIPAVLIITTVILTEQHMLSFIAFALGFLLILGINSLYKFEVSSGTESDRNDSSRQYHLWTRNQYTPNSMNDMDLRTMSLSQRQRRYGF